MKTLEEILLEQYGIKRAFLKRKRVVGHWQNGEPNYEHMTVAGGRAMEKLINLIYEIGMLTETTEVAERMVRQLDTISESEGEY